MISTPSLQSSSGMEVTSCSTTPPFRSSPSGEQQLHGGADAVEYGGHAFGELVALGQEDKLEQGLVIAGLHKFQRPGAVEGVQREVQRLAEDLRGEGAVVAR